MATAAVLTDQYRVGQAQISASTVAKLTAVFKTLFNPSAVDGSFPLFLTVAMQIIGGDRVRAAQLAEAFYAEHRAALGVTGPYTPMSAAALDQAQVGTGLLYAGPITVKQAMLAGKTLEEAAALALSLTLATAQRYAADGGRFTIQNTAESDSLALGWARVSDGNPCYFCAMLASRGPVYKDARSAIFRADGRKYHNGCGCTAEPTYTRDQPWPTGARQYQALWTSSTKGLHGQNAINAFRRAHEGRT